MPGFRGATHVASSVGCLLPCQGTQPLGESYILCKTVMTILLLLVSDLSGWACDPVLENKGT